MKSVPKPGSPNNRRAYSKVTHNLERARKKKENRERKTRGVVRFVIVVSE